MRHRLVQNRDRKSMDASLAIVNVVLLLIFFFLATGALLNSPDYGVDLPISIDIPIEVLPRPILIIAPDGSLNLNGDPIAAGTLAEAIRNEPTLHVLADRGDSAAVVLRALDEENLLAVEIKLVTLHQSDGSGS